MIDINVVTPQREVSLRDESELVYFYSYQRVQEIMKQAAGLYGTFQYFTSNSSFWHYSGLFCLRAT